jgi:hypothetical protein
LQTRIDVDALEAGNGVDTDDGMDRLDLLAAHRETRGAGSICLRGSAMHRLQPLEVFLESRAEG